MGERRCPFCNEPVTGRRSKVYCSGDHHRAHLVQKREELDAKTLAAVGRTGLTVTESFVAAEVGRATVRKRLVRLIRGGAIAQVGERYFPASWARPA